MIKLTHDTISEDIPALCEWLKTNPQLTYGKLTKEFEKRFAEYVDSNYAIFVNSGSSANLLGLYSLKLQYPEYNTVIVPALCWATNPAPAHVLGYKLKFVDINLNNLSFDVSQLEHTLKNNPKSIIMMVDVLGLPPYLLEIKRLCKKYNAVLFEDACESLGSTFCGKKLGTFGKVGTYSFYYSHTASTIEGGMIVTDDLEIYNILLSCRSHGWARDWTEQEQKIQHMSYEIDQFNQPFTFYYPGFNLRPTEIQSFLGLKQLEKLPNFVNHRNCLYQDYIYRLDWPEPSNLSLNSDTISCFGMPICCKDNWDKIQLISKLKENQIEFRPLISGNIALHPVSKDYYIDNNLEDFPNANKIHNNGLYLPCHPGMSRSNVIEICELL